MSLIVKVFGWGPTGGWEFPVFWTAALVAQALLGDGAFALRLSRDSEPVRILASVHSH